MPSRATSAGHEEPLLDLGSFARRGPGDRIRFSPAQVDQIARAVFRVPEVVVKVTKGATSTAGAIAHLRYIDRNGELEIETDEGEHLKGKGIERDITADWDLDSAKAQGRGPYRGKAGRKCQRRSKTGPPLIVTAEVKVDHPPGLVFAALARRA